MAYQSIGNYGVIGNMRTAALVGKDGSIDWLCFPRFDAPSLFGAILDCKKGGLFKIAPTAQYVTTEQYYWPETNVLMTSFLSPEGLGEIADFMPMGTPESRDRCPVIRRVKALRGSVGFQVECVPAFNYGRDHHTTEVSPRGASFHSPRLSLGLATDVPLRKKGDGVTGKFTLQEGETRTFLLREITAEAGCVAPLSEEESSSFLGQTVEYWRQWIAKCTYRGRWREMVHRSALVLELLAYEPTGAIVAAPTCSLPENVGGTRNWDYRYSWIRDSAFTVYALLRIGLCDEADRFMSWLESLCGGARKGAPLQTVYGIDGRLALPEETLDHWEGYRSSRPVRIGNNAYKQLQMDIYGELMDAAYLYNKYRNPVSSAMWNGLRRLVDWVCDHWHGKDCGIWEVRGMRRDFVYSKVMCWVALDRGLRLANKRSLPADRTRWTQCRDQIYEEILQEGWNNKRQAFVQFYGSQSLDASNLIMPLVFFMAPSDPKMLQTLKAVSQPPAQGGLLSDGMVYRYDAGVTDDGLRSSEGTFNMCTFWLVEALTRLGKTDPAYLEKARLIFEGMLRRSNHLGLYSEESGIRGEPLGNFPQALAHLAFISAAVNLDRTLQEGGCEDLFPTEP